MPPDAIAHVFGMIKLRGARDHVGEHGESRANVSDVSAVGCPATWRTKVAGGELAAAQLAERVHAGWRVG